MSAVGLTRDARHRYFWNGEGPLPGVTTAIGVLDKPAVVQWAKNETAACAIRNLAMITEMVESGGPSAAALWLAKIPDYKRDQAADLGSRIHALAEQQSRGEAPVLTPEEQPFLDGYRRFLDDYGPQFLLTEQMVCSLEHGYGGTLDAIASVNGEWVLIDYKTSNTVEDRKSGYLYDSIAMQLAAYAYAGFAGRPDDLTQFPLPRIERFAVLHLRPELYAKGYGFKYYPIGRPEFEAFLRCLAISRWLSGPAKQLVGVIPAVALEAIS